MDTILTEARDTTATAHKNKSFYNELINTGKIDIIISGHDHDQQLISIPDKPTMIVSGTGSSYRAVPKKFRKVNPDLKFYSEALGCCVLDFRLDTLTVRFFDDFAKSYFGLKCESFFIFIFTVTSPFLVCFSGTTTKSENRRLVHQAFHHPHHLPRSSEEGAKWNFITITIHYQYLV